MIDEINITGIRTYEDEKIIVLFSSEYGGFTIDVYLKDNKGGMHHVYRYKRYDKKNENFDKINDKILNFVKRLLLRWEYIEYLDKVKNDDDIKTLVDSF